MKKITLFGFLFFAIINSCYSQANQNVLPQSTLLPAKLFPKVPQVSLAPISPENLQQLDLEDAKYDRLPKIARGITADLKLTNSGIWAELPNGDRVWRLEITIAGALGLIPLFDSLFLSEGATLHVYMPGREEMLGAFTHNNTPAVRAFNTGLMHGESCVIEYYEPAGQRNKGILSIHKIGYAYRWIEPLEKKVESGSGSCEVNVACSEGNNWRDQIRSVIRILVVDSLMNGGYCSGSLLNNTRQDCTPYILSAGHCTDVDPGGINVQNFSLWNFYFNDQASNCVNANCPMGNEINGCTRIAYSDDSNGQNGSDFLLLQLDSIPASYNVFYSGWDRTSATPDSGVAIHHPEGDCKKISTYDTLATSGSFGNTVSGTHWFINWAQTANGWGITEPGSSGCALFNQNGLVVGQLSGGTSCCISTCGTGSSNAGPDLFGKLWFDWNLNGATAPFQLQPWLDPDNTGVDSLPGTNPPCIIDNCSNDAGIADILVPGLTICDLNFKPQVLLRNFGNNNLTSVTIEFVFDNGTAFTQAIGGLNLAPGTDEAIDLPPQTFTPGNDTLTVITSNPNHQTDCNSANDTMTIIFSVFPPGGNINLFLSTDNSGSKTTWSLAQNGMLVDTGGPYIDERGGKQYNIPLCVDDTCFTFTIFSASGNGMTDGINGNFTITGPNGNPFYASLTNPAFGSKDTFNICVLPEGIQEVSLFNVNIIPNPSTGIFNLQFETVEEKNIRIFDAVGRCIMTKMTSETNLAIDLSAFCSGVYILQADCGDKRAVRKLVLR